MKSSNAIVMTSLRVLAGDELSLPVSTLLDDRHDLWLHWFEGEVEARYVAAGGGLEIIAEVLREWNFSPGGIGEIVGTEREHLRRVIERLAVRMDLQCPDIAACTAISIIERTMMGVLRTGDLSEFKTAQLLFRCLQRALSIGCK